MSQAAISVADLRWGDPAVLVGSAETIRRELGWRPRHPGLEAILETAWRWHTRRREG